MRLRILVLAAVIAAIPLITCAESQVEQAQPSEQTTPSAAVVQRASATQPDPADEEVVPAVIRTCSPSDPPGSSLTIKLSTVCDTLGASVLAGS